VRVADVAIYITFNSGLPSLLKRSDGNLFHWNHLMKGDKLVLHRSKRDWMWRQFFLSEEYTGSNYQYVGKVSVHDNGPRRSLLV
uniref:Uncharacterized protein n=1 Tax=Cyprinus carpio TaxID=7962 RepID=A0A8C2FIN5_CYPCA